MRLEAMSWKQAEAYFARKDLAVLPIGSIENHGSHLALGTDYLIPQKLTEHIDSACDVLILPALAYGVADHHSGFAGTISLGHEGLKMVVERITDQLYDYGIRRFVFLNGHGGNTPALQQIGISLAQKKALSAVVNWWQIAGEINPSWKGGHAGAEETAAMMAIDESYVQMEDYEPLAPQNLSDELLCAGMSEVKFEGVPVLVPRLFKDTAPAGWFGPDDPKEATAQWGKQMLDACGDFIVRFIGAFEKAPLPK